MDLKPRYGILLTIFCLLTISAEAGTPPPPKPRIKPPQRTQTALPVTFPEILSYLEQRRPSDLKLMKDAVSEGKSLTKKDLSPEVPDLVFRAYKLGSNEILGAQSTASLSKDLQKTVQFQKSVLEKIEYKEKETDEISDRIRGHLADLEARRWHFKKRVFFEVISWQTEATLQGPVESTTLLATNLGLSPGIGVSYENRLWASSLDLAGIYGSGGVSSQNSLITYSQSDVAAFGAKATLGFARVVASSGSELGLRASALYIKQSFTTPPDPSYSIDQKKALSGTISLFSRWRFNRFYLQTDFGRYFGRPATLWSLGAGFIL